MSWQNSQKWIAHMIILQIFCNIQIMTTKKENSCYVVVFIDTSYTDYPPDFKVNMTFGDQGTVKSFTWVSKEVKHPISKLLITLKEVKNRVTTLYNVTARLCDINSLVNKIPLLEQILQTATKQGNYSFNCPMAPGLYIMDNLRVGSRSPLLTLMYRPKASYVFSGGLFEETKNKTLLSLTTYKISFKVIKKPCKLTKDTYAHL